MKAPLSALAASILPILVQSYPSIKTFPRSITSDVEDVAEKTFDYIIAGGGLTGLTVASRLSEDPTVSVLVIEGGNDNHTDPRVYDVRAYGEVLGSDLDYNITSTPVSWRNNTAVPMVAGKTLGGSGSINGASWTKGPKTQYDILPYLIKDESWGFDALNQDMLRAECFTPPSADDVAKGANYISEYHGYNGPVNVSFAEGMFGRIQLPALRASQYVWKGLAVLRDAASGVVNGFTTIPNMVHPDASENRTSPYTAYIAGKPAMRENLVILTGHRATKSAWVRSSMNDEKLVASGIEFQASRDGTIMHAHAYREVLLAAGSMQSPQILELSGIGSPSVLAAAGVPLVRRLPGVGKNLQEQVKNSLSYAPVIPNFGGTGPPSAIAFPNVYQILREDSFSAYAETIASLPTYATQLEQEGMVASASATLEILDRQVYNLFNQSEAAAELFFTLSPRSGLVGTDVWHLVILARGTVHIRTADSWDHPLVDPGYFKHPLELKLQTLASMQGREVFETAPLADEVAKEMVPSYEVVPKGASYEEWEEWVQQSFTSVWHPLATLSCMKEEFGGVVDNRLKIYGIENVRVVDASVLPIQLSAHLSSSLYGIAEKAAKMIKEDQKPQEKS